MRHVRAQNGRPASGERIAKAIARAGLCSRREAEAWIAAGRVAVNGKVIASPARNVTADDRIAVDGKALPVRARTRLFLYHKPRGLLTTHADPGGRPTIFTALPKGLPRLISVGRLDLNTEGLLLLTNDGSLARTLELPATGWLRRYRVRAHGRVGQSELDRLRAGITVDGIRYGPIEATLDRAQGSNVWLIFAIREGKNREVKNVLGHLGLKVSRLIRVSFGPFELADLAPGEIAEVKTRTLREQLGERVIALAGADFSAPMGPQEAPAAPVRPPARADAKRERRRRHARARGALARRGVCAVHRRRCRGARAAARECRGAGLGRRHPHFPARCAQPRHGASGRAVLARLSRSALRPRPGRSGAGLGPRRRLAHACRADRRRGGGKRQLCPARGIRRARAAPLRRHRPHRTSPPRLRPAGHSSLA